MSECRWQPGRWCGNVLSVAAGEEPAGRVGFFHLLHPGGPGVGGVDCLAIRRRHHRVLIQAWDFVRGSNWVQGCGTGSPGAERTIAVLSPDYLESEFGTARVAGRVEQGPRWARSSKLLTVRVKECDRPDFLGQMVSIDLFGITRPRRGPGCGGWSPAAVTGPGQAGRSRRRFPGGAGRCRASRGSRVRCRGVEGAGRVTRTSPAAGMTWRRWRRRWPAGRR